MSAEAINQTFLISDNGFSHFPSKICKTFAGSSILNLIIHCWYLSLMIVNEESLGVQLLIKQKKQHGSTTLGSGIL